MKRLEFIRDVMIDGAPRKAGDVVEASKLPEGTLASLLYVGHVRELPETKPEPAPSPVPTKPAAKK